MSQGHSALPSTKTNLIAEVFAFYSRDFTAYFAAAVSITETMPEQVNNEVRNAFTHLARASAANDIAVIKEECAKARLHIERANRDCLKCSIIYHHKQIDEKLNAANLMFKAVPSAILARWNYIHNERKKLLVEEHKGSVDITDSYQTLLLECEALNSDIRTLFGNMKPIRFSRTKGIVYTAIAGVFIALIATAIWEVWIRDIFIARGWMHAVPAIETSKKRG